MAMTVYDGELDEDLFVDVEIGGGWHSDQNPPRGYTKVIDKESSIKIGDIRWHFGVNTWVRITDGCHEIDEPVSFHGAVLRRIANKVTIE